MTPDARRSSVLRIFLSSPGDVQFERETVSSIVSEINDVLTFLAPDHPIRLDLVRYETDAYPDFGQAQEVLNRQLPSDYDIFVGIMWKRFGTPTNNAGSGTEDEYRQAVKRRRESGRPTIMFYFCDEAVPFPRGDEASQLTRVVQFREELESVGYVINYPDRQRFRECIRGTLLRAVRDLAPPRTESESPHAFVAMSARVEMEALAERYEQTREQLKSGKARTRQLSEIVSLMRARAAATRAMLPSYQSSASPGHRLAAIVILQQFPTLEKLDWLAERMNPEHEKLFIGYAAAVALAQAARSLHGDHRSKLHEALQSALALASKEPTDLPRLKVLRTALADMSTEGDESGR